MLDIKFLRENPELVKENIKKKFQDEKLNLVDEVIGLDVEARKVQMEADELRSKKNQVSKQIGALMAKGEKEEADKIKEEVAAFSKRLAELEEKEPVLQEEIMKRMMVIPNMIDASVPIGKDDSCNVENERFGEPLVPDYPIPYGKLWRTGYGCCRKSCRKRFLLSGRRYGKTPLCCTFLCKRFYD